MGDPELERFLALPPEQRVLDRYRLIEPLGKGGFAPVWRAVETYGEHDLREVAVKLFTIPAGEALSTGSARSRKGSVVAEARALCRVEHPNVVRFYNFATDASGSVFGLVMEYVRGAPLDRLLTARGALDAAETIEVGVAIASALAALHAQGIIHRDIKPANVIDSKGVFKIIDFGISAAWPRAAVGAAPNRPPKPAMVLDDLPLATGHTRLAMATSHVGEEFAGMSGTVGYVDPYCMAHLAPSTVASDLYALGATMFECATGALPAVAHARVSGKEGVSGEVLDGRARPPSLSKLAPKAPAALAAVVDALLAPDPADRPGSAEDVLHALRAIDVRPARSPWRPVAAALGIAGVAAVAVLALRPNDDAALTPAAAPVLAPPEAAPPPAAATAPASATGAASSPSLVHPCASSAAAPGACVKWCDRADAEVACCPPGKPPGIDHECRCPPGGGGGALGCPAEQRSVQEETRALQAAFAPLTREIAACRGDDAADMRSPVLVELAPDGEVFTARFADGAEAGADAQRCLVDVLRNVHAPPPPGGTYQSTFLL